MKVNVGSEITGGLEVRQASNNAGPKDPFTAQSIFGRSTLRLLTSSMRPAWSVKFNPGAVAHCTWCRHWRVTRWSQPPRLWLCTRGAQKVTDADKALSPIAATVWGLGKVIPLEHPELRCVRLDLLRILPQMKSNS